MGQTESTLNTKTSVSATSSIVRDHHLETPYFEKSQLQSHENEHLRLSIFKDDKARNKSVQKNSRYTTNRPLETYLVPYLDCLLTI